MKTATKVVFNTFILSLKILITLAISLLSIPLILHALGQSDYGLYSLVGGIVAMLAFLNNSMSVSTQRFISVAMGEGDIQKINKVFNVNIRLHLYMGVLIVVGLELVGLFVFDYLNIDSNSITRAKIIYQFLVIATFANIICVPFNGIINAHEDMLYFSIIGIIDSLLILCVAVLLSYIPGDKLLIYGLGMMFVPLVTLLLTYLFVKKSYPNYSINIFKFNDDHLFKETFGFAGWNLLGAVAMICRNQGAAVIINLFFGTLVNAAYGLANQINGAVCQFSTTFQKAINPQLMKSEGMNNRKRLYNISIISSKFGVLALCMFAVPVIIEMPGILQIWLTNEIPPYAIELSQLILILSIVTQFSYGLMSAIQAVGNVRNYQMIISFIILLNLPISYLLLKFGYPVYYVTAVFVLLEIFSFLIRLLLAHRLTGIDIRDFVSGVIFPSLIIVIISVFISILPHIWLECSIQRIIITILLYEVVFIILIWIVAIDKKYRNEIQLKIYRLVSQFF